MTSYNDTIKPFSEFFNSLRSAKHKHYLAKKETRVVNENAFVEMKEYLIKYYQGLEVLHSFIDRNGSIFDCVPIERQSSVKGAGQKLARPPDLPTLKSKANDKDERKVTRSQPPLRQDRKDQFGNAMFCPPGTIPKRRITLEEVTRFKTLRNFFQKSPSRSSLSTNTRDNSNIPPALDVHKYAKAYQMVDNLGGHSILNLWDPAVDTQNGDIFSLSQLWCVAGSGANTQTVEVGWQVFPGKYFSSLPVLFIYWTADNYHNTGAYNLEHGDFKQQNNSWHLGGTFNDISIRDGTQMDFEAAFMLFQGNWWLYINGTPIGYYETTIFNNGPLASKASVVDFGGETDGTWHWPPMGSGSFAVEGYAKAAYQRDISYFPTTSSASMANLTVDQQSPWCYTVTVQQNPAPWNKNIFFGGTGGSNC